MWCFKLVYGLLFLTNNVMCSGTKPHIIVILAGDLGWNDVGFHGSNEIPTPNIDALAYSGVILNSHYTQSVATASQSAFLTGKYPIHTGMQHSEIGESEPWGLSLNETLLPQYLKKNGYTTHAVGKWGLGFYKKNFTPTFRGFDSHFGFWQSHQNYYNHFVCSPVIDACGYDMRRNMVVDWDGIGTHSTQLFTNEAEKLIHNHNKTKPMFMYLSHSDLHAGNPGEPIEAPLEEILKFEHIDDPIRRGYAALVSMIDQSVGKVVRALNEEHMLENSIIVFLSTSGAQTKGTVYVNHGSNYPFRGVKDTPWEGGMRSVAVVWSTLIQKPQRVANHLMHITDWLPTLIEAAKLPTSYLFKIDGINMWDAISESASSRRKDMVYNIDDFSNYSVLRIGDWKYINGTTNINNEWYGSICDTAKHSYDENIVLNSDVALAVSNLTSSRLPRSSGSLKSKSKTVKFVPKLSTVSINKLRNEATLNCLEVSPEDAIECRPLVSPCLFNVYKDPCERINLAITHAPVVVNLEAFLNKIRKTIVLPRNRISDPNANPVHWNNTWINWMDSKTPKKFTPVYWSPLVLSLICGSVVALFIILLFCVDYYYCRGKRAQRETPERVPFKRRIVELSIQLRQRVTRTSHKTEPSETQPLVSQEVQQIDYNATEKQQPLLSDQLQQEEFGLKSEYDLGQFEATSPFDDNLTQDEFVPKIKDDYIPKLILTPRSDENNLAQEEFVQQIEDDLPKYMTTPTKH